MPRVDFYVIKSQAEVSLDHYICKLTDKIYQQGHSVYIYTADQQQLQRLDDMLWTFADISFVPHSCDNLTQVPVYLGCARPPHSPCEILINLHPDIPTFHHEAKRIVEFVEQDQPERRQLARTHYTFYQQKGYELHSHEL